MASVEVAELSVECLMMSSAIPSSYQVLARASATFNSLTGDSRVSHKLAYQILK
jgi:hypothetical protein